MKKVIYIVCIVALIIALFLIMEIVILTLSGSVTSIDNFDYVISGPTNDGYIYINENHSYNSALTVKKVKYEKEGDVLNITIYRGLPYPSFLNKDEDGYASIEYNVEDNEINAIMLKDKHRQKLLWKR